MTRRWIDSGPEAAPEIKKSAALLRHAKRDVDPPPYARARVWVDLQDIQTQGRGVHLGWVTAAAVTASVAAAVVLAPERSSGRDFAEIASIEGTVESSVTAKQMPQRASVGQRLESGARVRTSPHSRSTVVMHSVGKLDLASATGVAVRGDHDRVRIELDSGAVTASVIPRKGRPPFSVVAGSWTVQVVGTVFTVERIGEDDVQVDVARGIVEVRGPSVTRRLEAGDRFSSRDDVAGNVERAEAPAERPATAPHEARPAAMDSAPTNDTATRRRGQRRRRARRRARVRDARRQAAAAPRTKAAPDTRRIETASAQSPGSRLRLRRKKATEQRRHAGTIDAPATARREASPTSKRRVSQVPLDVPNPQVSAPEPTPGELYEAASKEKDPKVAIKLFTRIAAGHGPMAEQAGLRAAQLSIKLRRNTDAEARFRQVLRKFPSGTYRQEARIGLIDTLVAMKKTRHALAEVEKFVTLHPRSERKTELMYVRGQIARAEGDCRRALPSFEAALSSRRGPDALYFKAWCQIQTRDNDGARATLTTYLKKYPRGAHARAARTGLEQLR